MSELVTTPKKDMRLKELKENVLEKEYNEAVVHIFNRPSVARAVLKTALSLIKSLSQSAFSSRSS